MENSKTRIINPFIEVRASSIHGLGCFAIESIPDGQRIVEYSGPKLNPENTRKALEDGNQYIFYLDSNYSVDGSVMSNSGKYVNHSCDPNCASDIVSGRIWIDATRDIPKGEEITMNYNYEFEGFFDRRCGCGVKNCLGYMIAEDHISVKDPKKLLSLMIEMSNDAAPQKKRQPVC